MPLKACEFGRKMRGGSQAHLLRAEDGGWYVVKFLGNPQGSRILINEYLAAQVFRWLGISTPEARVIEVSEEFLRENPEIGFQIGARSQPVKAGWHFGSRFPVDPWQEVVYDYVPDSLLECVENLKEYWGALVVDKWLGNQDARQAVYYRAGSRAPEGERKQGRRGLRAEMIDHGYCFGGPLWNFSEAPLQGLAPRAAVYRDLRGWRDLERWLSRVVNFPAEILDQAKKSIPLQWLEGEDADVLDGMLEALWTRRKKVPDLIEAAVRARPAHFPAWRGRA